MPIWFKKVSKLKAVDFFCSGGGMTQGMRQAGIEVVAGIDKALMKFKWVSKIY